MGRARFTIAASITLLLGIGLAPLSAQAAGVSPRTGECLKVPEDRVMESMSSFEAAPCTEVHNSDVFNVVTYPDNLGPPSQIAGNAQSYFWRKCSSVDFSGWLGRIEEMFPVRAVHVIRLASDEEWAAGARWVACTAVLSDGAGGADHYTGKLPTYMGKSSLLRSVWCATATPKSGAATRLASCTSKSVWFLASAGTLDGKVGSAYPKDLQSKADAECSVSKEWLLKPGTRPLAALQPKAEIRNGRAEVACFIAIKDWNGKR